MSPTRPLLAVNVVQQRGRSHKYSELDKEVTLFESDSGADTIELQLTDVPLCFVLPPWNDNMPVTIRVNAARRVSHDAVQCHGLTVGVLLFFSPCLWSCV